MPSQKFRKLNIDLPRQTLFDQRPWLITGLLLAFIVLLMTAYSYFGRRKKVARPGQLKENSFVIPGNTCHVYSTKNGEVHAPGVAYVHRTLLTFISGFEVFCANYPQPSFTCLE